MPISDVLPIASILPGDDERARVEAGITTPSITTFAAPPARKVTVVGRSAARISSTARP